MAFAEPETAPGPTIIVVNEGNVLRGSIVPLTKRKRVLRTFNDLHQGSMTCTKRQQVTRLALVETLLATSLPAAPVLPARRSKLRLYESVSYGLAHSLLHKGLRRGLN